MIHTFNGRTPTINETTYVAPGAQIIGNIQMEENTSVWFNAVLRGDDDQITVGEGSNIQDGSIVHVDPGFPVHIGNKVTVGHNAIIHGCTVKDGALIGMGASVLNGAVVEEGALVAAGAVVSENKVVKANTLVAGVPAKPIRDLTEENVRQAKEGALHYVKKGSAYKEQNVM